MDNAAITTTGEDKTFLRPHKEPEIANTFENKKNTDQHDNHRTENSATACRTNTLIHPPGGTLQNNNISTNTDRNNDIPEEKYCDDDDDDDESSDDSSSLDGESPYQPDDPTMTLTERRARNIERNQKVLSNLGMMHNHQYDRVIKVGRSKSKPIKSDSTVEVMDHTTKSLLSSGPLRRGMILPSCWALQQRRPLVPPTSSDTRISSTLLQLQQRYPHRSTQIRKLYSLISVPIHLSRNNATTTTHHHHHHTPFVTPPIIVTGPGGCGKTSIVRDVVTHLCTPPTTVPLPGVTSSSSSPSSKSQPPPLVALHAYVDCTTLDHIHIDEFISNVYTQWYQQVPKRSTSRHHHRQPKAKPQKHVPSKLKNDNPDMEAPKRVSRMRQAKSMTQNNCTTFVMDTHAQHHHLSIKGNGVSDVEQNVGAQSSVLIAIWTLGRSVQRLLNRIRRDHHPHRSTNIPLVLIVDHAEVLLCMGTTYSKSSHADRINFLVQLMLLPRTLGLNLTIIFISKNILLEHTALNNMNSQGTIQGHICPVTIHFPAYRKKSTFQTILLQSAMKPLIAGNNVLETSRNFHDNVYKSFLETLVQGLSDFTSDIKEYLRLGRGLWPLYITPLLPENIASTVAFVQKSNIAKGKKSTNLHVTAIENDMLSLLDQRFFPHLRHALEYGLGVLSFDSSGTVTTTHRSCTNGGVRDDLPILVKYLLLAVYICHTNRQEKDRQLFSIERNGRKRRKTKEADNEEEMAYGTTGSQQDAPKTMRPRTFPMERLYSLYVSIVSLNASKSQAENRTSAREANDKDHPEILRSIGNIRFLETMTYLRDIGVLHDFPKRSPNDPIRFSQRNVWTTITQDEAQQIAKSINFPLDRYIL